MANPEHLAKVKEGVAKWNEWRGNNYAVVPDLSEADLTQANLGGAKLRGADLNSADLRLADLSDAYLTRADLSGADLRWADLNEANLHGANLSGANFSGASLWGAKLIEADLRGADLSEANLWGANLSGADLTQTNLSSARLQFAKLDRATLTAASLWETQRAGWSIKGVICERAYWDRKGGDAVQYAPGEFEKLHSEQPCIELLYQGGISKFELNTLPALLHHLAALHPNCEIRLKSVEQTAGGAKVSLRVEDADQRALEQIKAEAERLQEMQIAYRDEKMRAERLAIEKRLLLEEVIPLMLAGVGTQVHIAGDATGVVIASGGSSVNAQVTINDRTEIDEVLGKIMIRLAELGLAQDQAAKLAEEIRNVQSELKKETPQHTAVSTGLSFIINALGNAAGSALVNTDWRVWLSLLKNFATRLSG